jgi:hypothetical protein
VDDQEAIVRLKQGDIAGLEALFRKYQAGQRPGCRRPLDRPFDVKINKLLTTIRNFYILNNTFYM